MKDLQGTHKKLFLFIALEGISLKPQNWKRQWDGKKHLQTLFTNMLKYRPTGRCCLLLWDRLREDDLLCKDWQKIFILWLYQISQRSCQISSHQCKLTRKNCRSEFSHVFTASMWGCRRPMRWTHFALLGFTASTSRALQGTLSLATEIKTSMSCPCHPCPNRSFYLSNPIDIWSCHYPCIVISMQSIWMSKAGCHHVMDVIQVRSTESTVTAPCRSSHFGRQWLRAIFDAKAQSLPMAWLWRHCHTGLHEFSDLFFSHITIQLIHIFIHQLIHPLPNLPLSRQPIQIKQV